MRYGVPWEMKRDFAIMLVMVLCLSLQCPGKGTFRRCGRIA